VNLLSLITYEEALSRCAPGGGEDGYCIACKVYAPSLPFGSEEEAICYACALRLAPAHPRLARALERPLRTTSTTVAL
jgi:hypothetical protein